MDCVLSSLAGLSMTKPAREATAIARSTFHAWVVQDELFDLADCV